MVGLLLIFELFFQLLQFSEALGIFKSHFILILLPLVLKYELLQSKLLSFQLFVLIDLIKASSFVLENLFMQLIDFFPFWLYLLL